jgi:integrative and conjugative element protein (TIGR02256 family)
MLRMEIRDKQIFLTKTVIDILRQFRQLEQQKNEKGGIVLGQVSQNGRQILVCRASVPGGQDRNKRRSFRRDRKRAQQIIEYEFYNSGGKNTYLGEWHTHPANKAIPSPQDIQMITEQFATNEMKIKFILLFVVAQEELFAGLYDGQKMSSVTIKDFSATIQPNCSTANY